MGKFGNFEMLGVAGGLRIKFGGNFELWDEFVWELNGVR